MFMPLRSVDASRCYGLESIAIVSSSPAIMATAATATGTAAAAATGTAEVALLAHAHDLLQLAVEPPRAVLLLPLVLSSIRHLHSKPAYISVRRRTATTQTKTYWNAAFGVASI
jgi:hypothetical protein